MADIDAEMVKRCQGGEEQAFEALVEKYQRRVIGLCFRHLGSYEEACDLAQEVFVQVFRHLRDFAGKSTFSTWLYRVTLNACYNRKRYFHSKGRDSVTSFEGLLERRETAEDSSPLLRDPASGALANLERAEELLQLRRALDSLDDGHKKVIELVDIEDLSYSQAAQVLDVPVDTVRSRLSRARRRLKEKLVRLRRRLDNQEGPEP